jgi:hypothetical protein
VDRVTKEIILHAKKCLPAIARATITTRFKKLGHQSITSLFDMESIAPSNLKKCSAEENFSAAPIGVQLSFFRLIRDKKNMPIERLNNIIHSWLLNLNYNSIN